MIRKVPVFATLLVLIAIGIMIRLGFWQLDRLQEKEAMLARYAANASKSSTVMAWPADAATLQANLYRHAELDCAKSLTASPKSGSSARGESGWAQVARCIMAGGGQANVVLGWSKEPVVRSWTGGKVTGVIAPGPRLVANPPLAGLQANALPDPSTIPNNHLSYAVQWFLFAVTALIIYALALRKRFRDQINPESSEL